MTANVNRPAQYKPDAVERTYKALMFNGVTTASGKVICGLVEDWIGISLLEHIEQIAFIKHIKRLLREKQFRVDEYIIREVVIRLFTLDEVTLSDLDFVCWRIAANIDYMVAGLPVPTLEIPRNPAEAPLQIIKVSPGWSKTKVPILGTSFKLKVIAGTYCPVNFYRWFPTNYLYKFARDIGIGGYRSKSRYTGDPYELYGMRFIASIYTKVVNGRAVITFDRFHGGQFDVRNKKLLKLRFSPCPAGYKCACAKCAIGEDTCPASLAELKRACRPVTLVNKLCTKCNSNSWFDGGTCMTCVKTNVSAMAGSSR